MNRDSRRPINVRLVLDSANKEWIIGKFASRLAQNLPNWGIQVGIEDHPSPDVDINHWMVYHYPWVFYNDLTGKRLTKSTMLITHVDDPIKLSMLKDCLREVVDIGICLSRMMVEDLVRHGIAREQLCYIAPGHDSLAVPRRVIVGITSRVYPDRRKREDILIKLAKTMRLDAFHFEIIGSGWEGIIPHLEAAGATVRYYAGSGDYQKDYALILEHIPSFDYYLYTGLDEGSTGLLDALAAGVATIVTPQGFHLDIADAITYPFWNAAELCSIFKKITEERQRRIDGVKHLTWDEYARQHAVVWRALLEGRQNELPVLLHYKSDYATPPLRRSRVDTFLAKIKFYDNARRSYFRSVFVRRYFKKPSLKRTLLVTLLTPIELYEIARRSLFRSLMIGRYLVKLRWRK